MAVTVEHLAHAIFVDRRAGASKVALSDESGAVSRASLVAQARWSDSEQVSMQTDDLDRVALQRLVDTCTAGVQHYAPDAPEAVRDEAVIRWGAWLHESPAASMARPTATSFRSSGAASLLSPWTRRPAVVVN